MLAIAHWPEWTLARGKRSRYRPYYILFWTEFFLLQVPKNISLKQNLLAHVTKEFRCGLIQGPSHSPPLSLISASLSKAFIFWQVPPVVSPAALSSHPQRSGITKEALLSFPVIKAPEWPDLGRTCRALIGQTLISCSPLGSELEWEPQEAQRLRLGGKWVPRGESRCCRLKRGLG